MRAGWWPPRFGPARPAHHICKRRRKHTARAPFLSFGGAFFLSVVQSRSDHKPIDTTTSALHSHHEPLHNHTKGLLYTLPIGCYVLGSVEPLPPSLLPSRLFPFPLLLLLLVRLLELVKVPACQPLLATVRLPASPSPLTRPAPAYPPGD